MRQIARTVVVFSAALALCMAATGCVKFGAKPPAQLLTISSGAAPQAGQSMSSAGKPVLAIFAPDVPRALDTLRVAVQADATSVAYVPKAQWAEPPRQMFRRLLGDTVAADGAIFVAGGDQGAIMGSRRLAGTLIEFGIDAATHEAVVTFDATLTSATPGEAFRQRFTARVPVRKIEADRVAGPISDAANKVAADVTAWVKAH
ncbi:MAG: membrane integrity-associated transporter subunit PqiC [Sphingobium sp.]|nr:membrane integrity-associated transporter subunit PqiC [Sphingobium sp.]MBP6111629.1 membrane integrity-associated transporter subunit PqiC [Sphingobium sp.]MBP8671204.1 membrane integrity-associated transporter subunit PqiC [Sphingobium sp.]MBP9158211.1 membrane integrity-associated transporter subunit PqiC [Sphingobium sp.]MCC6481452.1 membrane integrity-associated transporter subunit PqiC [Sphingomonadaceae bacterium]